MAGVTQQEEEQRTKEEKERTMAGVTQQEEDKKPIVNDGYVLLKVKAQDGGEVFFKIKRSTHLRILMSAYYDRQSVDFNTIAFLFDDRRLGAEDTPDELEIEDRDEIDAVQHQTDGGSVV